MVLLDKGFSWEEDADFLVYWSAMKPPMGKGLSIPTLTEKQAGEIRSEYIGWVHDLGSRKIRGKSIREHLRISENLSSWWMSSIAEKFPVKSPSIHTIFKLRVLEKLFGDSGCSALVLCSADRLLHKVISGWCARAGLKYRWVNKPVSAKSPRRLARLFPVLPHPIQAFLFFLRFLWTQRRFVGRIGKKISAPTERQITIVTYFPNIDFQEADKGKFRSRYWGDLHGCLEKGPWQMINWIWIYSFNRECSFKRAVSIRDQLNQVAERQKYYLLEEFVSTGVLGCALVLYLKLVFRALTLGKIRDFFCFKGSRLNFWPIMAYEWQRSCYGWPALEGSLMLAVFENLCQTLPEQERGLYLWENQPWERAFLAAWKKYKHGHVSGFQHSVLCPNDIRSFDDERSLRTIDNPAPMPDVVAVNGAGSMELLRRAKFPGESLALVEALRYLSLNIYSKESLDPVLGNGGHGDTLLVLTGYFKEETFELLGLLNWAAETGLLDDFADIFLKVHPYCDASELLTHDILKEKLTMVSGPLSVLLAKVDKVYVANSTSAVLEVVWAGVPVLIHAVSDSMNLSPLSEMPGIRFVYTQNDLAAGLNESSVLAIREDFFCLDTELPRWKSLLGMSKYDQ